MAASYMPHIVKICYYSVSACQLSLCPVISALLLNLRTLQIVLLRHSDLCLQEKAVFCYKCGSLCLVCCKMMQNCVDNTLINNHLVQNISFPLVSRGNEKTRSKMTSVISVCLEQSSKTSWSK